MQTPSPWATKADVEAAREELKGDIAALHAILAAMHRDLRAVQALLKRFSGRRGGGGCAGRWGGGGDGG